MLQQVTAEVQPRLAAQVNTAVRLDRTRMVNITFCHHFFCSWYIWQSAFHTPMVEDVAGPRDICQAVLTTSKRCLATAPRVSFSITSEHYVLNTDVDPKRLGSENYAIKEAQQAHTWWHRWYIVAAALAVASCIFVFRETLIFCVCRRSVLFLGSWLK